MNRVMMCVCVCVFVAAEDMQGKTEEEIEMMKMMGFASFDTTKVIESSRPAAAHRTATSDHADA